MSNLDFIVAKLHAARSRLYEAEALSRLCDLPSFTELAAALAPGLSVGSPSALQRLLTEQHVAALHRYTTLLEDWEAGVFLWLLRRYQVENLKAIIRTWIAKTAEPLIPQYTIPVPDALGLPVAQLAQSASMEALLQTIPDRDLRTGAFLGLADYEETGRPFFIEAGLDHAYYRRLHLLAHNETGENEPAVARLVDLELDIHNVMTLLRSLFLYSVPFSKIQPFLAPLAKVGSPVVDRIRSAPDLEAALPHIPALLLDTEARPVRVEDAETALWTKLYRTAHRLFYQSVVDFGAVVAFFYIKRVELANLIRVSESLRYGETGDSIRQKLVELRPLEARAR